MTVSQAAVRKRARGLITDSWQSQANLSLFLALEVLIVFVLPSLGFGVKDAQLYSDIGLSVLLISGIIIARENRILLWITSAVSASAIVMRWLTWHHHTPQIEIWSTCITMAAILAMIVVLMRQIFLPGRVTHLRIQGAIAVYILFGEAWAHAYHLASMKTPGSFNG